MRGPVTFIGFMSYAPLYRARAVVFVVVVVVVVVVVSLLLLLNLRME